MGGSRKRARMTQLGMAQLPEHLASLRGRSMAGLGMGTGVMRYTVIGAKGVTSGGTETEKETETETGTGAEIGTETGVMKDTETGAESGMLL
jgi:hypothetical protein